jgi:hypothetical protein
MVAEHFIIEPQLDANLSQERKRDHQSYPYGEVF